MSLIPGVDTAAVAAKDFIQRVITPPLEEVGLLISDEVKYWRFKNQVRIAIKAEKYLKDRGLKTKKVSLKVLTPLLEGAAMEEDESLQDKWAALLANTVAEGSEIETTLYSHILTQISLKDAEILKTVYIFSNQVQRNDGCVLSIFTPKIITKDSFRNGHLSIDNLIRLRLLQEVFLNGKHEADQVQLTYLGYSFMCACQPSPIFRSEK